MINAPIEIKTFANINLDDPFFDSLKADYKEFGDWFKRKAKQGKKALVLESKGKLEAFLYLKLEKEEVADVTPVLPAKFRMKVGTFKINAHGTKLGERFIKKIFDYAILKSDVEEVYVTIFPKHQPLIRLFLRYGFKEIARKKTPNGEELVLARDFSTIENDLLLDYPFINAADKTKYLLSIYPKFHTQLFPDSILNSESFDLIKDVSHTNSIHKVYICYMNGVHVLKEGDIVLIYRTGDGQGPARYRSVITSVCTVEELKSGNDFKDLQEYLDYCEKWSVFDKKDLTEWWNKRQGNLFVIKMIYNAALENRITRGYLLDKVGISSEIYWGFFQLTDKQFQEIIKNGNVNENLIVN